MTLESIIKAIKGVDEKILREYTKIAMMWEKDGGNIYHLSAAVGFPGYLSLFYGAFSLAEGGYINAVPSFCFIGLGQYDVYHTLFSLFSRDNDNKTIDNVLVMSKRERKKELFKAINRVVRLPFFLLGTGLTAKSAYNAVVCSLSSELFDDGMRYSLALGVGLLGVASSQYLKDRDSKLLQRDPFWKVAFHYIMDRIPIVYLTPQNVPVRKN